MDEAAQVDIFEQMHALLCGHAPNPLASTSAPAGIHSFLEMDACRIYRGELLVSEAVDAADTRNIRKILPDNTTGPNNDIIDLDAVDQEQARVRPAPSVTLKVTVYDFGEQAMFTRSQFLRELSHIVKDLQAEERQRPPDPQQQQPDQQLVEAGSQPDRGWRQVDNNDSGEPTHQLLLDEQQYRGEGGDRRYDLDRDREMEERNRGGFSDRNRETEDREYNHKRKLVDGERDTEYRDVRPRTDGFGYNLPPAGPPTTQTYLPQPQAQTQLPIQQHPLQQSAVAVPASGNPLQALLLQALQPGRSSTPTNSALQQLLQLVNSQSQLQSQPQPLAQSLPAQPQIAPAPVNPIQQLQQLMLLVQSQRQQQQAQPVVHVQQNLSQQQQQQQQVVLTQLIADLTQRVQYAQQQKQQQGPQYVVQQGQLQVQPGSSQVFLQSAAPSIQYVQQVPQQQQPQQYTYAQPQQVYDPLSQQYQPVQQQILSEYSNGQQQYSNSSGAQEVQFVYQQVQQQPQQQQQQPQEQWQQQPVYESRSYQQMAVPQLMEVQPEAQSLQAPASVQRQPTVAGSSSSTTQSQPLQSQITQPATSYVAQQQAEQVPPVQVYISNVTVDHLVQTRATGVDAVATEIVQQQSGEPTAGQSAQGAATVVSAQRLFPQVQQCGGA